MKLLSSVYKVRDTVAYIRGDEFWLFTEKDHPITRAEKELENDFEHLEEFIKSFYKENWKLVIDAYAHFNIRAFEAEALWGKKLNYVRAFKIASLPTKKRNRNLLSLSYSFRGELS
jgi:hypothetical protein